MTGNQKLAVGAMGDGTVVFYNPDAPAGIRRLGPAPNDLSDLTESTRIPTLSAFVRELLRAEQDKTEAQS